MLLKKKMNMLARISGACALALAALAFTGTAQAQLTLSVGSASNPGCDTTVLEIPLTVDNATNLGGFQGDLVYNAANLNFLGFVKGDDIADWGLASANQVPDGTIKFAASRLTGTAVTGSDLLLGTFRFECDGAACPSLTALTLQNLGGPVAAATVVNGQITCGEFPTIRAEQATGGCPGSTIEVSIFADNVTTPIGGFQFDLVFPNDSLDYPTGGVTKGTDTAGWGLVSGNQPDANVGVIKIAGSRLTGTTISGDVELCRVAFTCQQCPSTSALTFAALGGPVASFQTTPGSVTCVDNQPPVADALASLTVNLSSGSIAAAQLDEASSDPDSDPLTFLVNGNATYALTCADVAASPITLTLEVSDGSATDTDTTQVTVVDDIDPTLVTQNITATLGSNGSVTIDASDLAAAGTQDNCGGLVSIGATQTTFGCNNVGANTVTVIATDEAGNISQASATVTINDNTAPNAAAQNISIQLNAAGTATITAAQIDGGSSDNCSIASRSASQTTFDCTDLGANNVTLTVVDASGNNDTAVAVVTVLDQIAPNAIAQNISVSLDIYGNATIEAADVNNASTDNCGTPTVTIDIDSFDCTNLGPNNVVLTATDASSNADTATAVVTVVDDLAPTLDAVAGPITLALDATGTAVLVAGDVYESATDNCGVDLSSLSLSQTTFTCADLGSNTVTLTISDAGGLTATDTVEVIVVDTLAPVAIAQDITVQLDSSGNVTINASDVDNGSSDNCTLNLSLDVFSFTCANLGANTVTLTATDQGGLTSSATAVVTVEDTIDPVITAASTATVALGANGTATITADDLVTSVTDNCAVASTSIDVTSFNCDDADTTQDVTITATDSSGNIETFTVAVTVTDPNDACVVEEGEGEGVVEECTDLDDNGIYDSPLTCLDEGVIFGLTNVGVNGGCLLETRQVLLTNTDGTGDFTLSIPDPNNFEVTVNITVPRNVVPVGESFIFVAKVSCDFANLVSGDDSASALADNLDRDGVPVDEIVPGTYVLATLFQTDGTTVTEVPNVNATITYTGLEVNTVEEPTVYQHGTEVLLGTDGPRTNGDDSSSWNEATTELDGTDVTVTTSGLSVFVVTQPAPQVPYLSVSPNANYLRVFGVVATGSSRTVDYVLQNTGPGVVAGSASIDGTGFSIVGNANYTLAGATTATVQARFAPTVEGAQEGSITFTGGTNGPVTIQISGVGANVVKTAFFGCGASGDGGVGFGDIAILGGLLLALLAGSRLWNRAQQN
jgi:hypothetical protein